MTTLNIVGINLQLRKCLDTSLANGYIAATLLRVGTLGIVACYILDKVCEKASAKASPLFIAVWSVCFVLAVGALWEMMEYVTDGMLGLNSQQFLESGGTFDESIPLPGREALRDTMEDMLLNLTGALILTAAMAFRRVKENQKMRP